MTSHHLTWHNHYSVGSAVLDEQHKTLFALCSRARELASVLDANVLRAELHEVIDRLSKYTELHFRTEEAFMQQAGYPKFEEHAAEHTQFLETTSNLAIATMYGSIAPNEICDAIERWINAHILGSDLDFARHAGVLA
jgi:hemerythrin